MMKDIVVPLQIYDVENDVGLNWGLIYMYIVVKKINMFISNR